MANMTKKDYILTLLDALLEDWPLAAGLKLLVEGDSLDDTTLDTLAGIFKKAVKKVTKEADKEKFERSIEMLQKIKNAEMTHHEKATQADEELDDILDDA